MIVGGQRRAAARARPQVGAARGASATFCRSCLVLVVVASGVLRAHVRPAVRLRRDRRARRRHRLAPQPCAAASAWVRASSVSCSRCCSAARAAGPGGGGWGGGFGGGMGGCRERFGGGGLGGGLQRRRRRVRGRRRLGELVMQLRAPDPACRGDPLAHADAVSRRAPSMPSSRPSGGPNAALRARSASRSKLRLTPWQILQESRRGPVRSRFSPIEGLGYRSATTAC